VASSCKRDEETSGSIKRGKFLDKPRSFWFLKKDSAADCIRDIFGN
jgi:hypothetical protein